MYKHKKIAITGGPCAGKTTAMQRLVDEFTEKGYHVFVISETATTLMEGGIKPFGDDACDMLDFQRYVLDLQLAKEKLFEKYANSCHKDTIILCDRGIMDNRAYVSDEDFAMLLNERHLSEMDIMASYDAVIHLVTAALGASNFYTTQNNHVRTESKEEAIVKDRKTLNSWLGHKNIHIIGNETTFDEKINKVIQTIYDELGDPYPLQKQRKFLVDDIDFDKMRNQKLVKLEIEQFFIDEDEKQNTMIRKTSKNDESTYSYTIKKDTKLPHTRITTSQIIDEQTYQNWCSRTDCEPIKKIRYCFADNGQYYRLDVFEKPEQLIILETDLTTMNEELILPDFLKIDCEITDDISYRNINLYHELNCHQKSKKL